MAQYLVEWENQLEADNPLEAARQAMKDIANGETLAFTVTRLEDNRRYSVELNELPSNEVLPILNL